MHVRSVLLELSRHWMAPAPAPAARQILIPWSGAKVVAAVAPHARTLQTVFASQDISAPSRLQRINAQCVQWASTSKSRTSHRATNVQQTRPRRPLRPLKSRIVYVTRDTLEYSPKQQTRAKIAQSVSTTTEQRLRILALPVQR